jgi:hypothetical protein
MTLEKDADVLLTFFDFPAEHWKHLRTSNVVESPFATVRLRQRVTNGAGSRTKGLLMAYKLLAMGQVRWRRLDGAHNLPLVRAGSPRETRAADRWRVGRTVPSIIGASLFHRREDGSPLGLQQHHDEPGWLRVAGVAPNDVNIGGALVERLPCLERDGRLTFQLHNDLAFEHVDERMGVVPMDHVLCARRIRHLKHATLLARVVREIDREQFLHVCGFGRDGCEHQECRQVNAEAQVGFLHVVPFRIVVGTRYRRIDDSSG